MKLTIEYSRTGSHPVAWLGRSAKEVVAERYPGCTLSPVSPEAAPRSLRADAVYCGQYLVQKAGGGGFDGILATLTEVEAP